MRQTLFHLACLGVLTVVILSQPQNCSKKEAGGMPGVGLHVHVQGWAVLDIVLTWMGAILLLKLRDIAAGVIYYCAQHQEGKIFDFISLCGAVLGAIGDRLVGREVVCTFFGLWYVATLLHYHFCIPTTGLRFLETTFDGIMQLFCSIFHPAPSVPFDANF